MKNFCPILSYCDDTEELTTPKQFAEHVPEEFINIEYVKSKGIKRCFIIFYDFPEKNEFLSSLEIIFHFHAGSIITNVYLYNNALIAISPLGAPAAATLMEELGGVFGIEEFIAIGSAGCLDERVKDKFIIVEKAIRDEGVSYHYLKPDVYVTTNNELNKILESYLLSKNINFIKGVTWTNDAFYRETKKKVEMAKKLGAVAVEMECSAWASVAKYRKYKFSQLLYFSDIVKQDSWARLTKLSNGYNSTTKDVILLFVKDLIEYWG